MVAKAKTGCRSGASYLRRLSIVFAYELRLKIVIELYMREMSPSQFYEQFGGGSVSRVDHHFQRLAESGWLRLVREETGGRRRGATEHFYRAPELAVFDHETWSQLPYSVKVAFSWTTFKQLGDRVLEALEAQTFDSRGNRHLSSTPLLLDKLGWERAVAAVDALFECLIEEQSDAKLRVAKFGSQPMLATVALTAFQAPTPGSRPVGPELAQGSGSPLPFPLRLSKVFADELSLSILAELNLRQMSATQFHAEVGGAPVDRIRRRFATLAQIGWLKKVDEKSGGRRRGAVEYFYRATGPANLDSAGWDGLSDFVKATHSWEIFEQLIEHVRAAMKAGAFDARDERHLSWIPLLLDEQGWAKVIAAIEELLRFVVAEEEKAKARMLESGEEPIATTVGLAAFESPKDSVKAP